MTMAGPPALVAAWLAAGAVAVPAFGQETLDYGLPPASGSQNRVLPPPSGSQNPVLPPPSGKRYVPGTGGPFGEERRPALPPPLPRGGNEPSGSVSLDDKPAVLAGDDRIEHFSQIGPALRRCWMPPPMPGNRSGAIVVLRFSLRRDGSLFGEPRATWSSRQTDPALMERFSRSAIEAVHRCTPLRLSDRFGAGIAGRPFSIRFHGRAPSNERPI